MRKTQKKLCMLVFGLFAGLSLPASSSAQDMSIMSIEEIFTNARRMINGRQYREVRPWLLEVISQLKDIQHDNDSAKRAVEWCYFHLGISSMESENYDQGLTDFGRYRKLYPKGIFIRPAIILTAELHAVKEDWDLCVKEILPVARDKKSNDRERMVANQLLAEAYFRQKKWELAINPNLYVFKNSMERQPQIDSATKAATCFVKLDKFEELFKFLPHVYKTPAKYDVQLNLTLVEGADRNFDKAKYDRALMLYRLVYNKSQLIEFVEGRIVRLKREIAYLKDFGGLNMQSANARKKRALRDLADSEAQLKEIKEYPDYDQELIVRMAQTYLKLQMYWEALVLYRSVFENYPDHELAEQSLYSCFATALEMQNLPRAFQEAADYMDAYPKGEWWDILTLTITQLRTNREEWEKVVEVGKLAVEVNPKHKFIDQMLYYVAFATFQQDNVPGARDQFEVVYTRFPDSPLVEHALYWHGLAQIFLSEYTLAREEFSAFLKRYDDGPFIEDATYRLGVAYYGENDFDKAEKQLQEFVKRFPESELKAEALFMLGDIYAAWALLDKAIEYYGMVPDVAANMVQINYATFQTSKVMELEGRWDEIIALFEAYKKEYRHFANFTEATYWIGTAKKQQGKTEEYLQTFFNAIVQWGNKPEHYGIDMIMRDLIAEREQTRGSEQHQNFMKNLYAAMDKAREENKLTLDLRLRALFTKMASSEEVRIRLKASLMREEYMEPAGPITLVMMGDAATEAGQTEFALKIFRHFLAKHEQSDLTLNAFRGVAQAHIKAEQYAEAEETLTTLISRYATYPDAGWAQLKLGDIKRAERKFDEAIDAYQTVLAVKEWKGEIWAEALYNIGLANMGKSDYREASAFFSRIFIMYIGYTEWAAKAYVQHAQCMVRLQQKDEAIDTLKEMLKINELKTEPVSKDALELLEKLGGTL